MKQNSLAAEILDHRHRLNAPRCFLSCVLACVPSEQSVFGSLPILRLPLLPRVLTIEFHLDDLPWLPVRQLVSRSSLMTQWLQFQELWWPSCGLCVRRSVVCPTSIENVPSAQGRKNAPSAVFQAISPATSTVLARHFRYVLVTVGLSHCVDPVLLGSRIKTRC